MKELRTVCSRYRWLLVLAVLAAALVAVAVGRPPGSSDQSFRFVVLGDSRGARGVGTNGVNVEAFGQLLDRVKQLHPQPKFIVFTGDLVEGGKTAEEFASQYGTWRQVARSHYPLSFYQVVVGNHESSSRDNPWAGIITFRRLFTEYRSDGELAGYERTVYYFDYGSSRFIVLNSDWPGEERRISTVQRAWLAARLRNDKTHNFVFLHEPAFPVGPHYGDSLDFYPAERNRFWRIIDQNPVSAVFVGHEHLYARRLVQNRQESIDHQPVVFRRPVNQVVSGGAGAPLYGGHPARDTQGLVVPDIAEYHFVVVDVNGDTVTARAIDLFGRQLDHFRVTAPAAADPPRTSSSPRRAALQGRRAGKLASRQTWSGPCLAVKFFLERTMNLMTIQF